ncbi:hypothetical protein SAMN02745245_01615 [Anaerosphaera aminiphila DSM 21120]|uniref:UPF0246 protein SAMN02745245_01615 n=1 Tax=Anaerosphaera aminiphila DSM 21120 TaxID=1120995 RepID=A0A1M5U0A2_9FIRM|nr:peroxide stress protein YaaA [Anaerosphaera aminiphila]SHH56429.1 hypothetical protein SAMN02745245_01615 [Anaerosphaera aminiphila DSM 21120]
MKILITPSKEMKSAVYTSKKSTILFQRKHSEIINTFQKFTISDFKDIYKLNDNLAEKTYNEWQNIDSIKKESAINLFNGLMYRNMDLNSYNPLEMELFNKYIRIISPLYGVLRPFDEINEHRLDFSKNIVLGNNIKLIDFWKDSISNYLLDDDDFFINLLSDEYLKVISKDVLDKSLSIKFAIRENSKLKVHSTTSKKCRGQFVKYIVKNNIKTTDDLRNFNYDGFSFDDNMSKNLNYFFIKNI